MVTKETYHNINVRLITNDYVPLDLVPRKPGIIPSLWAFFDHFSQSLKNDLFAIYKFFVPSGYVPPILYPFNYKDRANQTARAIWKTEAKSQEEMLLGLIYQYEDYPGMKFVVTAIDYDFIGKHEAWINYPTQLYELAALKFKYQNRVIPLVCVDPRRYQGAELKTFVRNHILGGFGGISMYPEFGFNILSDDFEDLFQLAVKWTIPIVIYFGDDWISSKESSTEQNQGGKTSGQRGGHFQNINELLERRNNPKICLSYSGSLGVGKAIWSEMTDLIKEDNKVYLDVSGLSRQFITEELDNSRNSKSIVASRLLFGSQFRYFSRSKKEGEDQEVFTSLKASFEQNFERITKENPSNFFSMADEVYTAEREN